MIKMRKKTKFKEKNRKIDNRNKTYLDNSNVLSPRKYHIKISVIEEQDKSQNNSPSFSKAIPYTDKSPIPPFINSREKEALLIKKILKVPLILPKLQEEYEQSEGPLIETEFWIFNVENKPIDDMEKVLLDLMDSHILSIVINVENKKSPLFLKRYVQRILEHEKLRELSEIVIIGKSRDPSQHYHFLMDEYTQRELKEIIQDIEKRGIEVYYLPFASQKNFNLIPILITYYSLYIKKKEELRRFVREEERWLGIPWEAIFLPIAYPSNNKRGRTMKIVDWQLVFSEIEKKTPLKRIAEDLLKIHPETLRKKMRFYGLQKPYYRHASFTLKRYLALRDKGLSNKEIAKKFSISETCLYYYLKKYSLTESERGKRKPFNYERYRQLVEEGKNMTEIAREFNMSYTTLYRRLKELKG